MCFRGCSYLDNCFAWDIKWLPLIVLKLLQVIKFFIHIFNLLVTCKESKRIHCKITFIQTSTVFHPAGNNLSNTSEEADQTLMHFAENSKPMPRTITNPSLHLI